MQMEVYPGDPLTPGVGATKDAHRLPIAEAKTLTKIPVLPISYADAQPLLAAIGGQVAPDAWRGGLGITYHVGPGPDVIGDADRKSTRLNSSHIPLSRMPSSA